jgi:HEAT repeat protein
MGISIRSTSLALLLLLATPSFGQVINSPQPSKALLLAQRGQITQALELANKPPFNYEELRHLSTLILQQGSLSSDPLIQLLTLYGTNISGRTDLWTIYERGIKSPYPQIQLNTVFALGRIPERYATILLEKALMSNFYGVRLEAALCLSRSQEYGMYDKIESLMYKIPKNWLPFFPQIYANLEDPKSLQALKRLISSMDSEVLTEIILSVGEQKLYDLLPDLHFLATHHQPATKEACLWAFDQFQDETALPLIKKASSSSYTNVRLSAHRALYHFGDTSSKSLIEQEALKENLFAIAGLADIEESSDTLIKLLSSDSFEVRVNAAISLLNLRNAKALPVLEELLLDNKKDFALEPLFSFGKTFTAYNVVPSAQIQFSNSMQNLEVAKRINERLVTQLLYLPEEDFLNFAKKVFETNQKKLIPQITSLLANLNTPAAIQLLEQGHSLVGLPFTRMWCTLSLYQLSNQDSYEQLLYSFVNTYQSQELLQLRPPPQRVLHLSINYQDLSVDEKTSLLMATYQALASSQSPQSIDILLKAMIHGNPNNRYALAGLLLLATD